jgi:hypothetical protein
VKLVLAISLSIAGLVMVVVAAGMIYPPAAIALGGVGLFFGGMFLIGGVE